MPCTGASARLVSVTAVMSLLALGSCGSPRHDRLLVESEAPENWVVAAPGDSLAFREALGPEALRPDTSDRVLIDASGDSLVVELIDAQGRRSAWESWSGLRSGSQIPGCSRNAPELWNEHTGAKFDHVSGELVSPAGGEYRLVVHAFRAGRTTVTVTRADGLRVAKASVTRTSELSSGESREWRLRWSAHGSEFAHVELTQIPGQP